MIKTFRFLIDTTKAKMAAYPGFHVITDSHAGGAIVALCPLAEGDEPIFEGQYSFAPLVQRALENEGRKMAFDARLSVLVATAFREGRESMLKDGELLNREFTDRAWDGSKSRVAMKKVLTDAGVDV